MRHARHTHRAGLLMSWPAIAGCLLAVAGVSLAAAGLPAMAGLGLATLGACTVAVMMVVRERLCEARFAALTAARLSEQAETAAELERRDAREAKLADEVAAEREDAVVRRRQIDELRQRLDDEQVVRVRLETEFDRLAGWTRDELGRAAAALHATRDQLEQALRRAAETAAEAAELRTLLRASRAESVTRLPSGEDFVAARRALDLVWSARTAVAPALVSDAVQPAAQVVTFSEPGALRDSIGDPLPDPYSISAATESVEETSSEVEQPAEAKERLYRPFIVGAVVEESGRVVAAVDPSLAISDDDEADMDLTAFDATLELAVREERRDRTA